LSVIIPALGRLRQEDGEFEVRQEDGEFKASMGCTARSCLKNT
jgi:hypothetical protein